PHLPLGIFARAQQLLGEPTDLLRRQWPAQLLGHRLDDRPPLLPRLLALQLGLGLEHGLLGRALGRGLDLGLALAPTRLASRSAWLASGGQCPYLRFRSRKASGPPSRICSISILTPSTSPVARSRPC